MRQGRGAALQHIREHGDRGLSNVIRKACLRNLVFDRDFDSGRGEYMGEIIEATGRAQVYVEALLKGSRTRPRDRWDQRHRMDVLRGMAGRGHGGALARLYELVGESWDGKKLEGDWNLVRADGLSAIEFLEDLVGEVELDWCRGWWASGLESLLGEEWRLEVEREAVRRPRLRQFLERLAREEAAPREATPSPAATLESVLEWVRLLEAGRQRWPRPRVWEFAKVATPEEIVVLASLLPSLRVNKARLYLSSFFRKVPLGGHLTEYLAEVETRPPDDRWPLLRALEGSDPAQTRPTLVRLMLRAEGDSEVLDAFQPCYEAGDFDLVCRYVGSVDVSDDYGVHSAGFGIRQLVEEHQDTRFQALLGWSWEHGPCSECREYMLDSFQKLGDVPRHILEEALLDSDADVRELAASLLGKEASIR